MIIQDKTNKNPKINRDLYYICDKYLKSEENRVFTITGLRRLGKTTILQTLNNKYSSSIMLIMKPRIVVMI